MEKQLDSWISLLKLLDLDGRFGWRSEIPHIAFVGAGFKPALWPKYKNTNLITHCHSEVRFSCDEESLNSGVTSSQYF